MRLSVVATLYNSEDHIEEFLLRMRTCAETVANDDFEIILVNDGSPDNSLNAAVKHSRTDGRIIVLDLSRNFGHHRAMMIGLEHTRGDNIFLIDCDLEEEPELLTQFWTAINEAGADVAFGFQNKRRRGLAERFCSDLFYRAFNSATGIDVPRNVVTARLMTRRYVNALLLHRERELFIVGLWKITGYDQVAVPITKLDRGKSSYTFRKKVDLAVNAITSFSNAPLIWLFKIGAAIAGLSIVFIVYLIVSRIVASQYISGYTSLMASIWLSCGLLMSSIGIIGIYMSKIFIEVKQRPYGLVREIYRSDQVETQERS